jgi:uncharacterized protein YciI
MFIVLLKLTEKRDQAGDFMDGHKAWLKRGFDDGVFLLAGGLEAKSGGGLLINNTTRAELEARISEDPFVQQEIVTVEIIELSPSKAVPSLEFLLAS